MAGGVEAAGEAAAGGGDVLSVVVLLAAAVIAVPLFRRIGLGSVLGYLAAGLIVGPFGFGFFHDPEAIIHVAELGVVLFLFVIGLEMQPSRLWAMRGEIFGLGFAQVLVAMGALSLVGITLGKGVGIVEIAHAGNITFAAPWGKPMFTPCSHYARSPAKIEGSRLACAKVGPSVSTDTASCECSDS